MENFPYRRQTNNRNYDHLNKQIAKLGNEIDLLTENHVQVEAACIERITELEEKMNQYEGDKHNYRRDLKQNATVIEALNRDVFCQRLELEEARKTIVALEENNRQLRVRLEELQQKTPVKKVSKRRKI